MPVIHGEPSTLSGATVTVNPKTPHQELVPGAALHVEDWWDRINGESWMFSDGNFAAMNYAFRAGWSGLPIDDNVVYGKINGLGYLVHVSELEA